MDGCSEFEPMTSLRLILSFLGLLLVSGLSCRAAEVDPVRRVLFVIGPSGHPPGTHEVAASARLLKYCVDQVSEGRGIETIVSEGWPSDPSALDQVRVIVFSGDMFPPYRFADSEKVLDQLLQFIERGGSIVCVHYATSVNDAKNAPVPPPVLDALYRLLGGFGHFLAGNALPGTQARILPVTISPTETGHPVVRGVKPFSITDEPYFPIRFDAAKSRAPVTTLATALLPPEKPAMEAVAWSLDRGGGSRSVGVLCPHYFANWREDSLRKLVVNGILWTAGEEIPANGYETTLPPLETFEPKAVSPAKPIAK
jgi:type 1 glutamine amidotransferase